MKRSDYIAPAASSVVSIPTGAAAAPDPASHLAEIGHSYFWNRRLRGPTDSQAIPYLIEGLQSIDITLETLPTDEGYRQTAISFVDHLVTTSLLAIRNGTLEAPLGLEERLEEFAVAWRLIGVRRDAVLRQASTIADLSVDLKPGSVSWVMSAKTLIATNTALAFTVELVPLGIMLLLALLEQLTTAAAIVLLIVWGVMDLGYKLCVAGYVRKTEENQRVFDNVVSRMARLVSSNLPLSQFAPAGPQGAAGLADDTDRSVAGGDEEEAEEIGHLFTQPPFLLHPDDALQRKNSIDAMLGEAGDDEGNITLRVKGFPKVVLDLAALNPHLLLVVTTLDGKVAFWNDGATTVTGFSAADAEGMKISSFLFGDTSAAVYGRMVEAALHQGDQTAKPLTLANATYGHVTVKGSISPVQDDAKEPIGFVLIASQQGERNVKQNLFHQYFLGELVTELKRAFFELAQSEDLGRCGHIVEAMRWNYLRDLASAAKEWHTVLVHGLLNEALRDRHRQVDVRVDPKVPEQIVCDQMAVSRAVAKALGLLQGRLRLGITRRPVTATNLLNQLLITAGPATFLTTSNLRDIHALAATVGGEATCNARQEIELVFPYLTDGAATTLMVDGEEAAAPKVAVPITILLFEKNAVYRHNISTIAFAGGHSVRIVEHVADALRALSEGPSSFGCAMIDVDMRDIGVLVSALKAAGVYLIEMTEQLIAPPADGDQRVVLAKPLSRADIEAHLAIAADSVTTRKREEDRITRQRAILSTQRNSPWVKGKKLGHGAFANVFEATSTLTGGKMAVKMIRLRRGKDEADRAKTLLNEIEILCQLQHPNIIHYFYCEPTEETLNLFMELATGGSMQDLLQRERTLPEGRVAYFTKELLQAVRYLHDQEIIHRDIKPGNILLSGRDNDQVKLTDFGTATQEEATDTQGTIEYMAPEVLGVGSGGLAPGDAPKAQTYSKECDIWSVGCVVCKCLGIERPMRDGTLFGGQGVPTSYPSYLSASAKEFITLCLQEEPTERATAGTLLLHDFLVNASNLPATGPAAGAREGRATIGSGSGRGDGGGGEGAFGRRGSVMSVWTDDGDDNDGGGADGGGGASPATLEVRAPPPAREPEPSDSDGGPLSIASDD